MSCAQRKFELIGRGILKISSLPFHNYLKNKQLILGRIINHWILLGIIGEPTLSGLCKYEWQKDIAIQKQFKEFKEFISYVNIGDQEFIFTDKEIEIFETIL